MEIEVGEYVRTEFGIGKIKKITIEPEVDIGIEIMPEVKALWINQREYFEEKDITKHSKNIIDLIEVGDVLEIEEGKYEVIFDDSYDKLGILRPNRKQLAIRHSALKSIFYENKNVKILTHEQYAANCYKLEKEGKLKWI